MRLQTDNLGKVAITIEKDYYIPDKSYDKLTVVQVKDKFATYVSRKPVPIGVCINNREYWIPFSSLKEDIVLDYNAFKNKYGKELIVIKERLDALEVISSRYLQLEDKVKELTELAEINIEKTDDLIKRAEDIIEEAEKNAAIINSMPALITTNPKTEYKKQSDDSKRLTLVEDVYSKDAQGLYRKDLLPKDITLPEARNIGNGEYVNGLISKNDKRIIDRLPSTFITSITKSEEWHNNKCFSFTLHKHTVNKDSTNNPADYDPITLIVDPYRTRNSDNPVTYGLISSDYSYFLEQLKTYGVIQRLECNPTVSKVYIYFDYKDNFDVSYKRSSITIPSVTATKVGVATPNMYAWFNALKENRAITDITIEQNPNVVRINKTKYWQFNDTHVEAVQAEYDFILPVTSDTAGVMNPTMYNNLVSNTTKLNAAGTPNNLAVLDENGKIPAANLPSFVDDVVEYESFASFPSTGEGGKIYVDLTTNKTYRWGGTTYVEISASIALGETSTTAFPGDRGKTLETKVKSIESVNTTQTSNISLLANLLLNTSAKVKVSANTLVIEAGIDTSIDIQYNAYVAGNSISPVEDNVESQSLDLGGGITINKPIVNLELLNVTDNLILPFVINSNTVDVTLNKTTTIQLKGTFKNIGESDISSIETNSIDKFDVITIHAYYPNYYSYEPSDSITIDDIKTSFIKAPLSPILNDEVLLSSSQDLNYLYVCIPNDIKSITDLINSVYEVGGLMIPMITISNVLINNKTYVLLRSETKLKGKTINIHVK